MSVNYGSPGRNLQFAAEILPDCAGRSVKGVFSWASITVTISGIVEGDDRETRGVPLTQHGFYVTEVLGVTVKEPKSKFRARVREVEHRDRLAIGTTNFQQAFRGAPRCQRRMIEHPFRQKG